METFAIFILYLSVPTLCAFLAHRKRRNIIGWFIAGLLFTFLALIAIAFLGPKGDPGQIARKTWKDWKDENF